MTSLCERGEDFWRQLPFEEPFNGKQREIHRLLCRESCGSEMSAHYKGTVVKGAPGCLHTSRGRNATHIPAWRLSSKRQMSTKHFIMQDETTEVMFQFKTRCAINRDVGGRLCAERSFKSLKLSEGTPASRQETGLGIKTPAKSPSLTTGNTILET